MPLVLNEEQTMLKDAAKEFCTSNTPVSQLRGLRDKQSNDGFHPESWQQMVKLGWAGITIPEMFGGLGFGYLGMGVVMEECGRKLTASPLYATVALGATAIVHGGTDALKSALLPQVVEGNLLLALALEETPHHNPYGISTTVTESGNTCLVTGSKKFVLDGHIADKIVVVARSSGKRGDRDGITLVLVDNSAATVKVTRTHMADARNAANIEFSGARGVLLGEAGKGADLLDLVLDTGRILLAAEMLGGAQECFERTLHYLKEREQFGVVIGTFQALKHRAANMFCELELSRSVILEALSALDSNSAQIAELASLAKARLNDTYHQISSEGIQMHGGIGMTDEHEIGFFIKRSRVCELTLGSSAYHRDRYGLNNGY